MSILDAHLGFVKEQVVVQERLAKRYSNDPKRQDLHVGTRDRFQALAEAMVEAGRALDAVPPPAPQSTPTLGLLPEEIEGLPEDLMAELSESALPDKSDLALLQILNERGGIASLDQILVDYYKKNREVLKRTTLTSRLYRMVQKGAIYPVPEKKGAYSTRKLSTEDAAKLFGLELAEQPSLV